MRRLFTAADAARDGVTRAALRWGERAGRWRRLAYGVYGDGSEEPTELDLARAKVLASGSLATGGLAGVLLDLDGVTLAAGPSRRRGESRTRTCVVDGIPCTDALQTLVDLAALVDDLVWEQALESALRRKLVTIAQLHGSLGALSRARTPGVARIRRVLALRPPNARPTGSLLETLTVQLARSVPNLPDPVRQLDVVDEHGAIVATVDLAWPELGLFIELDGQQHKDQPVYDARRETAVVAATGWLCGRFTWREVAHLPVSTKRRLAALVEQARRRPISNG